MTFFIPRNNVIESDEGFSVEVLGRVGLRYMETGHIFHVDSEILAGPSGLILYSDSIKPEGSTERSFPVDPDERRRIAENIRAAFQFRGFEIQVV